MLTAQELKRNEWKSWMPKRGEVYLIDLGEDGLDSEQRGKRPCAILSNNKNNQYSSVVHVAPLTSQKKTPIPVHVDIDITDGIKLPSTLCLEQAKSISKRRAYINNSFIKITQLSENKMREIDEAIRIQFGLN